MSEAYDIEVNHATGMYEVYDEEGRFLKHFFFWEDAREYIERLGG